MANVIQSEGKYTRKSDGTVVTYSFEYQAFNDLDDAVEVLTEVEVLKLVQRQVKVDANNVAREKAKCANGDSDRKIMSEEEKAQAKQDRAENKKIVELARSNPEIAELLKAQGIEV